MPNKFSNYKGNTIRKCKHAAFFNDNKKTPSCLSVLKPKIMNKNLIFGIILSLSVLFSCTKEQHDIDRDILFDLDQQVLLSKMDEASIVIAQFANNDELINELDRIIKLKMYNDDYIRFSDLFTPFSNEKLKSENIETTLFEKCFDKVISENKLKSGSINDLKSYLVSNNLALYIPYPAEMFPKNNRIPTISYHPLVNDSINKGIQAISENNQIVGYKDTIVNDEYALKNLCYLIVPAEKLGYENGNGQLKSVATTLPSTHFEIRVGAVYCFKQYDGLFEGGSEIFFGNVTGDINLTNGQVTAVPKGFRKDISRTQIALLLPVDINALFLAEWKTELTQISMFVFEDDPSGTREISGSVKTTASIKVIGNSSSGGGASTGTVPNVTTQTTSNGYSGEANGAFEYSGSWKSTIQTQDSPIYYLDYPRDWFFALNSNPNSEWGAFSEKYQAIYRGVRGEFMFCLAVRENNY